MDRLYRDHWRRLSRVRRPLVAVVSFLRRGRFLRSRLEAVKISTRATFEPSTCLRDRQMEKRAELVSSGANVDKPQARIDYEGLPIG